MTAATRSEIRFLTVAAKVPKVPGRQQASDGTKPDGGHEGGSPPASEIQMGKVTFPGCSSGSRPKGQSRSAWDVRLKLVLGACGEQETSRRRVSRIVAGHEAGSL